MRDHLIHRYFSVDPQVLYEVVKKVNLRISGGNELFINIFFGCHTIVLIFNNS